MKQTLELLSEAATLNPGDPAILYEIARVLQAMGRGDEALAYAGNAVSLDEDNKWYNVLYANLAKANNQYAEYVRV